MLVDGRLQFTLSAQVLCLEQRRRRQQTTLHREGVDYTYVVGGIIAGIAATAFGIYSNGHELTSYPWFGLGIVLFGFAGSYGVIKGGKSVSSEILIADQQLSSPIEQARCSAEKRKTVGSLLLTTPWGSRIPATLDAANRAVFDVDWGTLQLGSSTKAMAVIVAQPWKILSPRIGLGTSWEPSSADVAHAVALVAAANSITRDDSIAKTGPAGRRPRLEIQSLSVEGSLLTAGHSNILRLTLRNNGNHPALGIIATTISQNPAMNNLRFVFEPVLPETDEESDVVVKLPANDRNDSDEIAVITVVVHDGDDRYLSPENFVQRLPIARSLCTAGTLTKEQFDEKREKLRLAATAGAISPEEYARYEAELSACMKTRPAPGAGR